jgi:hypothetical protein
MAPPFWRGSLLAALIVVALPGCRATGAAGTTQTVEIAVTNDVNQGAASISIVGEGGIEEQLGVVTNLETRRLVYTGSTIARRFRLRALFGGAGEIVSDSFLIPSGSSVAWTLRSNFVRSIGR